LLYNFIDRFKTLQGHGATRAFRLVDFEAQDFFLERDLPPMEELFYWWDPLFESLYQIELHTD
jgi:hypothetical protein